MRAKNGKHTEYSFTKGLKLTFLPNLVINEGVRHHGTEGGKFIQELDLGLLLVTQPCMALPSVAIGVYMVQEGRGSGDDEVCFPLARAVASDKTTLLTPENKMPSIIVNFLSTFLAIWPQGKKPKYNILCKNKLN